MIDGQTQSLLLWSCDDDMKSGGKLKFENLRVQETLENVTEYDKTSKKRQDSDFQLNLKKGSTVTVEPLCNSVDFELVIVLKNILLVILPRLDAYKRTPLCPNW